MFENIECQWPIFFCYLALDGLFNGKKEMVKYQLKLTKTI